VTHDPCDMPPAGSTTNGAHATPAAFAAALDEGDLDAAASCLAPDCVCRDGALTASGAEAVVALYRAAVSWAERGFDDVRHVSTVESSGPGMARIAVTSMLMRMPGRWHRLRFARELTVDSGGRVTAITHVCEPGAAAAFRVFVRGCGVPPPPPGFGA
jgi:hypothetical protein